MSKYEGKSATQLVKILQEKDDLIVRLQTGNMVPTRKEALEAFLAKLPPKELALTPLEVAPDVLSKEFAKSDTGDKKITETEALKILSGAGFSKSIVDDLVGGFFQVAKLDDSKRAAYMALVDEIVRMQTYKVMRVIQFRLGELEKKKDTYDKMPKMSADDIKELFLRAGLGEATSTVQLKSLLGFQVGKNVTSVTTKGLVRWYFYTYFPEEKKETKAEEKATAATGGELDVVKAKAYVDSVLTDLKKAVDKPAAMKAGSPDQLCVHFMTGKLLGVMELAAGGAIPESQVAKIFGDDDDATDKLMEKCIACGVEVA